MKALFFSFFTLFSFSLFGQTYVLDQTFGDNGTLQLGAYNHIKDGFVTNNTAYFLTNNGQLLKVNSDGTNLNNYYFNFTIPTSLYINNFKLINNSIYLYGEIAFNNTYQYDIFIAKLDLDGNPDLNFGINGMKIIDFGQIESTLDIVATPEGGLLCSGVRYQSIQIESNIILFKINALTGDLNSSFDSNGYKTFTSNLTGTGNYNWLRGGFIFNYDNGYLLAGNNNQNSISYLTLIKIDGNGNADSNFGVNGYKSIPCSHSTSTFEKISIHDNKIYGNYSYPAGSLGTSSNIICYDLINDQTLFDFSPFGYSTKYVNSFNIFDNSIYNTYRSNYYNNTDKFYVEKRFINSGLLDSSFHINGQYSYDSPSLSTYNFQDEARVILKFGNDFLIAGYSKYTYAIAPTFPFIESVYEGGTLIKITPGVLETNNYESNTTSVDLYPNPFENEINFEFYTQIKSISIYDLVGRKIIDPKYHSQNNITTVDLTGISNKGTYLIKINTAEDSIITKKIVKN